MLAELNVIWELWIRKETDPAEEMEAHVLRKFVSGPLSPTTHALQGITVNPRAAEGNSKL